LAQDRGVATGFTGTMTEARPDMGDRTGACAAAVKEFGEGKIVMVMDDFDRENECDFIALGETMTKAQMAFMIKYTTGIVCVVAEKENLERVGLYPAARMNTDKNATAFYVATDYLPTTTTGVSAGDRVETIKALVDQTTKADDFSKPGHMFPLCPKPGGVLQRGGHTESAYDLCRLAGKARVSAIGELMREDGEMMRFEESVAFAKTHGISLISVEELREEVKARGINDVRNDATSETVATERCVEVASDADVKPMSVCTIPVRTMGGADINFRELKYFEFKDSALPIEVIVAQKGEVRGQKDVAVRIHSECFTGDVLRSAKCDCGLQLDKFFSVLENEPCGLLLYVRGHEGRGIGFKNKMDAYALQEGDKMDTVDANIQLGLPEDLRDYADVAGVIKSLGVETVRLFTNNPDKIAAVEKVLPCTYAPCKTHALAHNVEYLKTKEARMNHFSTREEPAGIEWPKFGEYSGFTVSLIYTSWNREYVQRIVQSCEAFLKEAKCEVALVEVPGALDLVAGAKAAVAKVRSARLGLTDPLTQKPSAVICIGIFIQGDTGSATENFQATSTAIQNMNAVDGSSSPIINGVLFCNTEEQARERATAALGQEWAKSALQMVSVCEKSGGACAEGCC